MSPDELKTFGDALLLVLQQNMLASVICGFVGAWLYHSVAHLVISLARNLRAADAKLQSKDDE